MRLRPLVPGIGLLVALSLSGTALAQTPVSAEEFAARVERAAELTDLGDSEPSTARMEQVRETLGLPAEIEVGSWVVLVPQDPYLEALSGDSAADFERAGNRLRASQRALEEALAREVPEQRRVEEALDRAYSGVAQVEPSLLDRIFRPVAEIIGAVLYRLVNFVGPSSILVWAVLLGLAVAAVVLLRRARLVPDRVRRVPAGPRAAEAAVDWSRRAEEALGAGDLREAVRAFYLALLSTLAAGGLLADAPALTAGEARAAVRRARPTMYPAIAQATDSYERVVYGGAIPDEADIQGLREAQARARTR